MMNVGHISFTDSEVMSGHRWRRGLMSIFLRKRT